MSVVKKGKLPALHSELRAAWQGAANGTDNKTPHRNQADGRARLAREAQHRGFWVEAEEGGSEVQGPPEQRGTLPQKRLAHEYPATRRELHVAGLSSAALCLNELLQCFPAFS